MSNSPIVHALAQTGFGTGTNELYDRARPSYQSSALSHIRKSIKSSSPLKIVEVGAGTGIFTRALLAHPEWSFSVQELKAVEPSQGMREVFSNSIKDERVAISDGTFDHTGVIDGWADLVVIAQAFHWCPDYDAAAAEFARVLKPDGVVALIWNLEDRQAARWVSQLRGCVEAHEQGSPQFRLGLWRQVFDTSSYNKLFNKPEETVFNYKLPGSLDIVINRALSKSYIAVLSDDKKAQVIEDIKKVVERGDDKIWVDKDQGLFEYPYQTFVVMWEQK